jgi:pyridoxine 5'-phosphate synthase PdxJ
MNKICNQNASKKAFYTSNFNNGRSNFNFEETKKKKKIITELKKNTKCNYYHEKGHWAKECYKKKEDKKKEESFVNLIETSGFATSVGYAIATSHGLAHRNNIHDWIVDAGDSKHMID